MHPTHKQESEMDTITSTQPMTSARREFGRRAGLVALFGAATAAAYVGIHVREPLLFAPVLCALGALVLPRGSTLRVVLLAIAAAGCVAMLAVLAFYVLLIAVFSGVRFG